MRVAKAAVVALIFLFCGWAFQRRPPYAGYDKRDFQSADHLAS